MKIKKRWIVVIYTREDPLNTPTVHYKQVIAYTPEKAGNAALKKVLKDSPEAIILEILSVKRDTGAVTW